MNSKQHFLAQLDKYKSFPQFFFNSGILYSKIQEKFKHPSNRLICKTTIRHLIKHIIFFLSSAGRISYKEAIAHIGELEDELNRVPCEIPFGLKFSKTENLDNVRLVEVNVTKLLYESERFQQYLGVRRKIYDNLVDIEESNSSYRERIFDRRSFPPKLKFLIFERDNFTCQICLRTKEKLLAEDLHLEADHIIEWEDGGDTCYRNGQTVCSACNKAKHAAKKSNI